MFKLAFYGAITLGAVYFARSLLPSALITNTQTVTPSSVTLEQVQKLGELTTIRLPVQVVVPAIATREIMGIPQQTKVLYVAQVHVVAGFDLTQATVTDGAITLPAATILDAKVDVNKSSVFDSSQDWLAPDLLPELLVQAQQEALKAGVVAACNSGVLAQAGVQAKVVVGAIASGKEIIVSKSTGCAMPKERAL